MKAEELRIGNYIRDRDDLIVGKVELFYGQDVYIDEWHCGSTDLEDCEPIPLTEEWLLKFGFVNISLGEYKKEHFTIDNEYTDKGEFLFIYEDTCIADINYVHQLQNLYFALTVKELTLK